MLLFKVALFLIGYGFFHLLYATSALAWGPGVHTALALSSIDASSLFLPWVGQAITSFPIEYMYGCLSADFFIGKGMRTGKPHPHTWEGGFQFLRAATDDRGRAYALGFLSHLAADVIAHNFYVPNLLWAYPGRGKMGHLFWEIRADYLIGSGYTRIARGVVEMDHRVCDDLLTLTAGRKNRLRAGKGFYARTVRLSERIHATRDFFLEGRTVRWRQFHGFLSLMLDLSKGAANDFLKHPDTSPCLSHDPMGTHNLLLAGHKRPFARWLRTVRQDQRFDVGEDLLYL